MDLAGFGAPLGELNCWFAAAIREGRIAAENPAVRRHLILTTIEKMEVAQPNYPAYRALHFQEIKR